MKHAVLVAAFFSLMFNQVNAQAVVWNKELPIKSLTQAYCSVQQIGDRILFCGQKSIVELNPTGAVTGATIPPPNASPLPVFSRFLREKTDGKTGERYFLLAHRTIGVPSRIVFSEYRPGFGFVHETALEEGTISGGSLAPAIVDITDSTFMVFGKNWVRHIVHRPGEGVVVSWQKPYFQGNVNAAIRSDDGGFISATQTGNILAISENGDSLWKTNGGLIRDLKKTALGFVVCGRSASNKAMVVAFSGTGTLLWSQEYADDKTYEHIIVESDGSLTVTGQSMANEIVLHRLNVSGVPLWRKTYQAGTGGSLAKTTDGGYVVGGGGSGHFYIISTDSEGNTGAFEPPLRPEHRKLENGTMSLVVTPTPTLFFNGAASSFVVPKDSSTTLFFGAAPWLSSIDTTTFVPSFAGATFGQNNQTDYRPGLSKSNSKDLARTWAVSRAEIESLRKDWADNGVLDSSVPFDILTWPAKNNPNLAKNLDFSMPSLDRSILPAPFVDINGDGLYAIADGDYPRIKGDHMVWWALTDSTKHTFVNTPPLEVDLLASAYLYDCPSGGGIQNTLFVDYEIINRNKASLINMFAGLWSDTDLGCHSDDYVGSIPSSHAYYVYNQDAIDGTPGANCDGGTPTFGDKVPVASVCFRNVVLNKFIQLYNTPTWPILQPVDANGTPVSFEHNYPDNPADPNGNSMCSANLAQGDRRTLGSTGPYTLAPNDTFLFRLAFTYHPDIPHPCPDIYGQVKNDIDQLRDLANSGALDGPVNLPPLVQLQPGQSVVLNAEVPGASAYLWSAGSTSAHISVSQPGTYTVTITKATGCQSVETVVVRLTSEVQEKSWLRHFRLFPNPNNGQFRVEMSGPAQDEVEFALFNAVGQLVRREVEGFGTGSLSRSFDYGQLSAGVYALRVQAGGKSSVRHFVIGGH